ncbi:MAG TPA: GNAT family N-acetyltransferase [Gaiellaceae bacterium]|nr:GNAT family N-acetyltransferase [Gaiellaceae bacterium]
MDLLERFDEQVRRRGVDEDGLHVGDGWSAVLTVPPDVDRALARLRGLPGHAEWKLYGHDPAWLPGRLRAAGLEPGDEETVVVAEIAALPQPPDDVELRDDVEAFLELAAAVFGDRHELPDGAVAVVALVDGRPVSGGRVDLDPDTEFAGLFGGVTLPEHRGRGLYRATVLERARIARGRGYRYLYVDALPTSRPILERLGFTAITTTTPWTFA